MVNDSSKLLYCLRPKCASRRMRQLMFPRSGQKSLAKFSQKHLMVETYFKFTFVREPFEHLLSAYKDKFVYTRSFDRKLLELHGREILKNFRPNATQRALEELNDITFREFIEYLVTKGSNSGPQGMDRHWDIHVYSCCMCDVKYDFIGHYETLEQDLADFITAAGLSGKDAKRYAAVKMKISPSGTASQLLEYYSQVPLEWIDTLGRIYKANFQMFGYNFPGPLKSLL
ncbi:hypothetical protein OS493_022933 [Desmophyllum pertusum]|uniref:Carbohydrate sulfotransferase n=1 Tax=Desmophyllum pertusum TaxID=174260 RepID=A0A9X0D2L5_9CNID|nr:hypothetical protein OS493_022933 [Desmophyllum pertusum]